MKPKNRIVFYSYLIGAAAGAIIIFAVSLPITSKVFAFIVFSALYLRYISKNKKFK